jgi:hypothetical protein
MLTAEDLLLCRALAERLGIVPEAELARLKAAVAVVLNALAAAALFKSSGILLASALLCAIALAADSKVFVL